MAPAPRASTGPAGAPSATLSTGSGGHIPLWSCHWAGPTTNLILLFSAKTETTGHSGHLCPLSSSPEPHSLPLNVLGCPWNTHTTTSSAPFRNSLNPDLTDRLLYCSPSSVSSGRKLLVPHPT